MAICTICNKGRMIGHNIRHKHTGLWERKAPKTQRVFGANIQNTTLLLKGVATRLKICTKCLKRVRKEPGWHHLRPLIRT